MQEEVGHFLVWLNRLPWEAWTAFGTWILALATWALALYTRNLVRRSQEDAQAQIETIRDTAKAQVEAAQQAAKEQMAVTERMANANIQTLEEDLKTRLLMHYESRWDSQPMKAHRRELSTRRLSPIGRRSVYIIAGDDIPNFFESVGILVRRGHLDTEMVWSIFGYYASRYWQALGDFIVLDRQSHDDNELWSGFEYLVSELHKFEAQKRGRPHHDFSKEELDRFLREEMIVPN